MRPVRSSIWATHTQEANTVPSSLNWPSGALSTQNWATQSIPVTCVYCVNLLIARSTFATRSDSVTLTDRVTLWRCTLRPNMLSGVEDKARSNGIIFGLAMVQAFLCPFTEHLSLRKLSNGYRSSRSEVRTFACFDHCFSDWPATTSIFSPNHPWNTPREMVLTIAKWPGKAALKA